MTSSAKLNHPASARFGDGGPPFVENQSQASWPISHAPVAALHHVQRGRSSTGAAWRAASIPPSAASAPAVHATFQCPAGTATSASALSSATASAKVRRTSIPPVIGRLAQVLWGNGVLADMPRGPLLTLIC